MKIGDKYTKKIGDKYTNITFYPIENGELIVEIVNIVGSDVYYKILGPDFITQDSQKRFLERYQKIEEIEETEDEITIDFL